MNQQLIDLIWEWGFEACPGDHPEAFEKADLFGQPDSPITCIKCLEDGSTLCDVSFSLTNRLDIMDLLTAAFEANLQVETVLTVSTLRVVRFYFQPQTPRPDGTH